MMIHYPPSAPEKKIDVAYRFCFINKYPEIVTLPQFKSIYTTNKKAERIAQEIINARQIKSIEGAYESNRGKRGPGKKMQFLTDAYRILFTPKQLTKPLGIEEYQFYYYMKLLYEIMLNDNIPLKEVQKICYEKGITPVIFKKISWATDIADKIKLKALNLKNVRLKNKRKLSEHINRYLAYLIKGEEPLHRDRAFYQTKNYCIKYFDKLFDSILDRQRQERIREATNKTKEVIKNFSESDRAKILGTILKELFPENKKWAFFCERIQFIDKPSLLNPLYS